MMTAERIERRRVELERELGEPITVDGLTATWRIFQRKKGHRHSTDDLLTAWYALEALEKSSELASDAPHPHPAGGTSILDLGTGIGTVGLLVLSCMPFAELTCVEAQDVSFRFLHENIRANGVEGRVRPILGDLRELSLPERFPLVTGSPPYFDVRAGIVPADLQKAHARFELRGDVGDYARAAKRHLTRGGLFVFCFPWQQKERGRAAAAREGFTVVAERDVVPREGLAPLLSLFACQLGEHPSVREEAFVVRRTDGAHTEEMHEVRARFGWPRSA